MKLLSEAVVLQKARFERGKELLEAEFRSLLTRYSKPVPPVLILDAIGGDEDMEVQEDVTLEHLPEAVLQDIICISAWLLEYGRNQGALTQTLLSVTLMSKSVLGVFFPFVFPKGILKKLKNAALVSGKERN